MAGGMIQCQPALSPSALSPSALFRTTRSPPMRCRSAKGRMNSRPRRSAWRLMTVLRRRREGGVRRVRRVRRLVGDRVGPPVYCGRRTAGRTSAGRSRIVSRPPAPRTAGQRRPAQATAYQRQNGLIRGVRVDPELRVAPADQTVPCDRAVQVGPAARDGHVQAARRGPRRRSAGPARRSPRERSRSPSDLRSEGLERPAGQPSRGQLEHRRLGRPTQRLAPVRALRALRAARALRAGPCQRTGRVRVEIRDHREPRAMRAPAPCSALPAIPLPAVPLRTVPLPAVPLPAVPLRTVPPRALRQAVAPQTWQRA